MPKQTSAKASASPKGAAETLDTHTKREFWFLMAIVVAVTIAFAMIEAW